MGSGEIAEKDQKPFYIHINISYILYTRTYILVYIHHASGTFEAVNCECSGEPDNRIISQTVLPPFPISNVRARAPLVPVYELYLGSTGRRREGIPKEREREQESSLRFPPARKIDVDARTRRLLRLIQRLRNTLERFAMILSAIMGLETVGAPVRYR